MASISTIDCVTGERIYVSDAHSVVVNKIDDCFIFGYTTTPVKVCTFLWHGSPQMFSVPVKNRWEVIYDNRFGYEVVNLDMSKKDAIFAKYCRGRNFPYHFRKEYEAVNNLETFKDRQKVRYDFEFPVENFIKYSFGLEFETSNGIIPEEICFADGLIPLRDGSISGNEYSTVVLQGHKGFNLLYQQLETLRKYTRFDKECSLHIHFGGFPLEPKRILSLFNLCCIVQSSIAALVPKYTFRTSQYKSSGKDYCNALGSPYTCFEDFYAGFTGLRFFGSLQQPHPLDIDRARKWNIPQRYYWVNLLNLICYRVNKTVEFRLLRPSYNLEKILTWMYVFNAILVYAETHDVSGNERLNIFQILKAVYPADLYDMLETQLYKLEVCVAEQDSICDYIGMRTDIDDEIFDPNKII